jgi:hypothetical protein
MTDEEINRKFDVVADHLATLAVGQQRLQETQARTEGSVRALLAVTEIQSQEIRELGQEVREVSQGLRELGGAVRVIDERQREADERNRETDERLSALINMVERYISERRNGKSDNRKSDN